MKLTDKLLRVTESLKKIQSPEGLDQLHKKIQDRKTGKEATLRSNNSLNKR